MQYCRIFIDTAVLHFYLPSQSCTMQAPTKKTVVLGATTNPARTAYLAVERLVAAAQPTVPIGIRQGEVAGLTILNDQPAVDEVDTVSLYIGPDRQPPYYDYILNELRPQRIIFNPGTENPELAQKAREAGIEPLNACTLVMLATGQY